MRKLFVLGVIIALSTLVSCSGDDESQGSDGLRLTMPEQRFILPGTGNSCVSLYDDDISNDIPAFRFSIPDIELTWSKTAESFSIIYVQIEMSHSNISGGEYKSVITGDELDRLLGLVNGSMGAASVDSGDADADGDTTDVLPLVAKSNSTTYLLPPNAAKESCALQFGGINIADEDSYFTATATITFVGIATGNGNDGSAGKELAAGEGRVELGEERAVKIRETIKARFEF